MSSAGSRSLFPDKVFKSHFLSGFSLIYPNPDLTSFFILVLTDTFPGTFSFCQIAFHWYLDQEAVKNIIS